MARYPAKNELQPGLRNKDNRRKHIDGILLSDVKLRVDRYELASRTGCWSEVIITMRFSLLVLMLLWRQLTEPFCFSPRTPVLTFGF